MWFGERSSFPGFKDALGAVEPGDPGIHALLDRITHEQLLDPRDLRFQGEGDLGGGAVVMELVAAVGTHWPGDSLEGNMAVRFVGGHLDVRGDRSPPGPLDALAVSSPGAQLTLTLDLLNAGAPAGVVLGVRKKANTSVIGLLIRMVRLALGITDRPLSCALPPFSETRARAGRLAARPAIGLPVCLSGAGC